MATVIDAFMTTLGLDGTQFRRGMDEATDAQERLDAATQRSSATRTKEQKRQDEILRRANTDRERQERNFSDQQRRRHVQQEARTKGTIEGYRQVRNSLIAIATVFTAGVGIKNFIFDTINTAANLGYLSDNLKQSTESLTAYQRASERAGGSGEGIIAQLKESADTLAQLKSGLGPNEGLQNFFRWGGNADELKDGNTYLLARSRIIHDLFKTDPAQAALISKQLGIAEDQFNFLKQGPDAVLALVAAQEKNAAITRKNADDALALKNKMLDLRDSLQSTATRILLQLAPTIELLLGKLEKASAWAVEHKDDIAKWVADGVKWIGKAIDSVDALTKRFDNFFNSPAWNVTTAPIVLLFKAISAAIDLAVLGFDKLAKLSDKLGVSSAVTWVVDKLLGGKSPAASSAPTAAPNVAPTRAVGPTGGSRGVRNNNPGNIEYGAFTKARGATGTDGRFAQFDTPQAGVSALAGLLRSYGNRGFNSVDSIINRYAPGSENNTAAYSSAVSKKLGVKGSDTLNLKDPAVLKQLVGAIIQHENGYNPYSDQLLTVATMSNDQKQANAAGVARMPSGAAASLPAVNNRSTSTSTSDIRIDQITVQTQATDAAGIAQAIRPAVEKYTFTAQANTGLN